MRIFITVTLILALGSQWAAGQCYMQKDAETVLLMNFNKASGTLSNGAQVPDESGNNNNGVIVGSGSFRQGAEGKNGLFLREMDYIKIMSSASLSPADEITIEVWASIDKPNVHAILRKKGAYTFPDLQGTNTVKAQIVQTNGVPFNFPAYIAGIKTNDQRARYFAMTFKGKDMAMYFTQNTSPRSHKSMTRTVPLSMTIKQSNGEIWIGKNFPDESYAEHLEGILYSVRISKKARTCQDIQKSHFCDSVAQINECCSNPCKNGGTCKDEHGKHTCDCLTGFKGVNCEDVVSTKTCADKPCKTGEKCTDTASGYSCSKKTCADKPCKIGEKCTDTVTGYTCNTTPAKKTCADKPCKTGEKCTDTASGYSCTTGHRQPTPNCSQCTCRNLVSMAWIWACIAVIILLVIVIIILTCCLCCCAPAPKPKRRGTYSDFYHEPYTPQDNAYSEPQVNPYSAPPSVVTAKSIYNPDTPPQPKPTEPDYALHASKVDLKGDEGHQNPVIESW